MNYELIGKTFSLIAACALLATLCAFVSWALYRYSKTAATQLRNAYHFTLVSWELRRLQERGAIDYFLKDGDRTLPGAATQEGTQT